MTPRPAIVSIGIPLDGDDIARAVRESGHSCFPVVNGDLDDLVGLLFVNDLFRSGRHDRKERSLANPDPMDISRRLRQAFVLPETTGVLDALAEMRRQHRTFAVVVDEYGSVSGVLTIKDLLEPLVGELHDEFDGEVEPEIVRVDSSRWLLDGRTNVDEVRDRLGVEIPDGEYVTLGGFLLDGLGHIPEEGEILKLGPWEFRVADMEKRRIARVIARHSSPRPAPATAN